MIKKILQTAKKVEYCRPLLPHLNNSVLTCIVFTNLCLWFEMLDTEEFVRPITNMEGVKLLSWEQELGITEKVFIRCFAEIGETFSSEVEYDKSKTPNSYFYMYLDDKGLPHWIINKDKVEQLLVSIWSFSPYLNLSTDDFKPVIKKQVNKKLDLTDCLTLVNNNLDKISKFKSEINWDEVQRIARESYKNGVYKSKTGTFDINQLDTVLDDCLEYNKNKQLAFKDKIDREKLSNTEKAKLTDINLYASLRTFITKRNGLFFTEAIEQSKPSIEIDDTIETENINKYF